MADPVIAHILAEIQAVERARFAGLCLKHNCNHYWREAGRDWDQAVLCCTQYLPMPEAAAEAIRVTAEQARAVSHRELTSATSAWTDALEVSSLSAKTRNTRLWWPEC